MQRVSQYTLAASGGAMLVIRCTLVTSKMFISEDGSTNGGAQQGLIYNLLREPYGGESLGGKTTKVIDGMTYIVEPTVVIPPGIGNEPLKIEGYPGDHPPHTAPLGGPGSSPNPVTPGGVVTLGTPIVQLTSASANAAVINVTEWSA